MRVRKAGYRVVAAEDCFIHHFGQKNRRLYEQKWNMPWTPHQPRNGVRPAYEDVRFDPDIFCVGLKAARG